MRVVSLTNADSVRHPDTGDVYEAGDDGVFDLPEPFATHLVRKHASHWRSESEQEAQQQRERIARLKSPHEAASVMADLVDRVEALETVIEQPPAPADAATAADMTGRVETLEATVEQLTAMVKDLMATVEDLVAAPAKAGDATETADGREPEPKRGTRGRTRKTADKPPAK